MAAEQTAVGRGVDDRKRTNRRVRRPGLVVLAAAALMVATSIVVLAPAPEAEATHFRANQTSWVRTAPDTVEFTITTSYRASYFGTPAVGDTFSDFDYLYFGDGDSQAVEFTAIAVDAVNDVVTGQAVVSHTYASAADQYWASLSNCCRLSGPQHVNNPDADYVWRSLVDLSQAGSPVSAIPPIVDCPADAECAFTIPVSSPAGGPFRFRLATGTDGLPNQPPGASVDATTGRYIWDTTGAYVNTPPTQTFYSTAVVVEKVDSAGRLVGSTTVDFFIRIGGSGQGQAPFFVDPTPADGTTLTVELGDTLSFPVAAHDEDGDVITLGMLNKPADADYTQGATAPGDAEAAFTWTPDSLGSTFVTLTAMDATGLSAVQRSITIEVIERTGPDPTVPDTTVPDTTVPDTTVPDTTVPDTTVPDTTVPDTSASDTTVVDTTVPQEPDRARPRPVESAAPDPSSAAPAAVVRARPNYAG